MSEYQCSSCGREYSRDEARQLDREQVDPDEDNPKQGQGFVKVCECGHAFFKDDWQEITEVETSEREFRVSTTHLVINHGTAGNPMWYETCVFWNAGSYVLHRYRTQSDAEDGHGRVVEALRQGNFDVSDSEFASLSIGGESK